MTILIILLFSFTVGYAQESALSFERDSCTIHGTLLSPETTTKVPLVILIAGSGPTDRDCNQPQMKTNAFKMIAESLQAQGIATLRFDKRMIGQSVCPGAKEADLRFDDYIEDVKMWVEILAGDKRFSKVIICGHSEGSLIGLAATKNNSKVNGVISIAGLGRGMDVVLKEQLAKQAPQLEGLTTPIIDSLKAGKQYQDVPIFLNSLFRASVQPYLISCMSYDPAALIASLSCPVLILQGDNDIQVAVIDAELLSVANPKAKKVIIPSMTHVLKNSQGKDSQGQMDAYYNPTTPLNPAIVSEIVEFVK